MGLFSRKEPAGGTGRRTAARTSSEAQAEELRVRARRRLIGALVLVLTAVIFVPMLFDSPPEEEIASPVVLPEHIPPIPSEPQVALAPEPPSAAAGSVQTPSPVGADTPAGTDAVTPEAPAAETPQVPEPVAPEPEPEPQRAEAPRTETPRQETKPPARAERTDDGSVALALLEGRGAPAKTPSDSKPAAPSSGSFVLQVAAYTSDADAQARREKLVAAGVTNAYVEQAVANGKTAHRLRVGPFPTREAAEAAQARLRQLGYNNGLIFNK